MKQLLIKLHWFLSSQLGLDPLVFFKSLRGLRFYVHDVVKFRKYYKGKFWLLPCLHDRFEEGGVTKSEYFWQDLLVARWIFEENPIKHVDVGSRIDGFVAHVASFREIEVFDVRPVTTSIPGVVFHQADLMDAETVNSLLADEDGYSDSLSCLHALEHFGLGRYGDPVNQEGHIKGFSQLARLVKPDGRLYLSLPIGYERVEFNANRVFDPHFIIEFAGEHGFVLDRLIVFSHEKGSFEAEIDPDVLKKLAAERYNLGIFVFTRKRISK
ncbi:DUF268 domain-containing protein [Chlorobium sp. KB01]|uniref:DUF268 domain-containing protein n=1 Tax=Chlorobium sp. KB01 TaxID=1917528 RepID=UPI0009777C32|nr:DUF268 domain-containing protein [Chlorobium sp. KB01]